MKLKTSLPQFHFRGIAFGAALVLAGAGIACACNVPVFRFALERWRPDPYRAVLFHRGPLSAVDREQFAPLESQAANLSLRTVDLEQIEDAPSGQPDALLWETMREARLPTLVVQYPASLKIPQPVWAGSPSALHSHELLESPVRKELIRRLAEGETAVWLLLESGQPKADEAAAQVLKTELKKLETDLELPELTTNPEDALLVQTPLRVAFSQINVRRDDPAEQALRAMLIGSEPDLAERTDPMVFPVYGRGRALWGLIGAGITAKNIRDSAGFLVGPCSCEVKELNPGFDLLMKVDWDLLLSPTGAPLTSAVTRGVEPTETVLVPIPAGSPNRTMPDRGSSQSSAESVKPVRLTPRELSLLGIGIAGLVIAGMAVRVAQPGANSRW